MVLQKGIVAWFRQFVHTRGQGKFEFLVLGARRQMG
jgi:hypothetical protein